jgi:hypothetical protein
MDKGVFMSILVGGSRWWAFQLIHARGGICPSLWDYHIMAYPFERVF